MKPVTVGVRGSWYQNLVEEDRDGRSKRTAAPDSSVYRLAIYM